MSVRDALCSLTVAVLWRVRGTVNAIELDSTVAHCASVRGDVQITKNKMKSDPIDEAKWKSTK